MKPIYKEDFRTIRANTFSGVRVNDSQLSDEPTDISAWFGGENIGCVQEVNLQITKQILPPYMSNPDPRTFSKGQQAFAGSLTFINLNRGLVAEKLREEILYPDIPAIKEGDPFPQIKLGSCECTTIEDYHLDQFPPFDIVISLSSFQMVIAGAELLVEGWSCCIDGVETERSLTYLARNFFMRPIPRETETKSEDPFNLLKKLL